MRKSLLIWSAVTLTVLTSPTVLGADEDDEHAAHTAAATNDPRHGIENIEALMARIVGTAEPDQRRELLARHLGALRDQMKAIRVVAARPAPPADATDDPHAAHRADAAPKTDVPAQEKSGGGMMKKKMKGGMMKKHEQVEQRLDMLERMLQQLIEHEAVERELEHEAERD